MQSDYVQQNDLSLVIFFVLRPISLLFQGTFWLPWWIWRERHSWIPWWKSKLRQCELCSNSVCVEEECMWAYSKVEILTLRFRLDTMTSDDLHTCQLVHVLVLREKVREPGCRNKMNVNTKHEEVFYYVRLYNFVSLNNRELLASTGLPGCLGYRYVLRIHTTNFTENIWLLWVI